jgi:glycine cleavage system H lipoate-binding protein
MANEVKILSGRMLGEKWREFERTVARYLSDGWTVIGFTAERDQEHGDIVYVMLQREATEAEAE